MPSYIEIDQNLTFPSSSGAGKVIFGVNTAKQATITDNAGITTIVGDSRPYKVYTALLTQSGGDGPSMLNDEPLTIGVTYQITDQGGSGWDFTNVGAPNNNIGTYFVATGTTPNSWGDLGVSLNFNTGAPVVIVLENTIGNIWFTYDDIGFFLLSSDNLFNANTFVLGLAQSSLDQSIPRTLSYELINSNELTIFLTSLGGVYTNDNFISIEIRVYN